MRARVEKVDVLGWTKSATVDNIVAGILSRFPSKTCNQDNLVILGLVVEQTSY